MSKVMNQLFLGSKTEEEIELSNDPEYEEWSESVERQIETKEDKENGIESGR